MNILSTLLIAAGTHFGAGCTPDGACWPSFLTSGPVLVQVVDAVPNPSGLDLMGLCLVSCKPGDARTVVLVKQPNAKESRNGWTVDSTTAHEAGHREGVTRHKGE